MQTEKRHFHRIMHDANATLTIENLTILCTVLDISLKGCLLKLSQPHEINLSKIYPLSIRLSEDIKIEMEISPTHIEGQRIGAVCRKIDLDSITHLRRLIELNSDEPGLLERELHEFIHYKP